MPLHHRALKLELLQYVVDCLDSDNDTFEDNVDIDDDNDGITDVEEGFDCQSPTLQ